MKKFLLIGLFFLIFSTNVFAQDECGQWTPLVEHFDSISGHHFTGGLWHIKNYYNVVEVEKRPYVKETEPDVIFDTFFLINARCVDTACYNAVARKYGKEIAESSMSVSIVSFSSSEPCSGEFLQIGQTYKLHLWLWNEYWSIGHGGDCEDEYVMGARIPCGKARSQAMRAEWLNGLCLTTSDDKDR